MSLAGHCEADGVGLQDSHCPHHVSLAVGTVGQGPSERLHHRHPPHVSHLRPGRDVLHVVHQHLHPPGRVRVSVWESQKSHDVDEAHSRVGRLPHGEVDVYVEAGEEATLNAVLGAPGTVRVTDWELTLWTGVASPPGQAVTTLGTRFQVWPPDCRPLIQYGLAWSQQSTRRLAYSSVFTLLDILSGHHAVADPLSMEDLEGEALDFAPALLVKVMVMGGAGGVVTVSTHHGAGGLPAQPALGHLWTD